MKRGELPLFFSGNAGIFRRGQRVSFEKIVISAGISCQDLHFLMMHCSLDQILKKTDRGCSTFVRQKQAFTGFLMHNAFKRRISGENNIQKRGILNVGRSGIWPVTFKVH